MSDITIQKSQRVVRPLGIVLEHVLRLPTSARLRRGIKTTCDVCRQPISDEYFYGGFSAGHRNVLLHERCTPDRMRTHTLTGEPVSVDAVDPHDGSTPV